MSKVYFHFLAPAALLGAGFLLMKFAPAARQEPLWAYAAMIYLVVAGWRYFIDRSSPAAALPVRKLPHGIPPALQDLALREYEYIRETMAQAMNDRHTMVNYFLLATGVVLAAIGAIYSAEGMSYSPYKNHMTIAVCLIFNLISWIYLMMVIRLRQAWCESAAAMNRIKLFALLNLGFSENDAASPFRWKTSNIPPAAKKGTLYHFAVILISVVSSSGLALASLLFLGAELAPSLFWISAGWFLYNFLLQNSAYGVFLKEASPANAGGAGPHLHAGPSAKKKPEPTNAGSASGEQIVAPPQRPRVVLHKVETLLNDFFKVQRAIVQFEKYDGGLSEPVERLIFERGHSVVILLYDAEADEFVFVEQFRYPTFSEDPENGWMLEAIAGMIDTGENPLHAARREALEETGYEAREVEALAEFYVSPGGSTERISVFWGRLGRQAGAGGGKKGEMENIRVVRMPVAEAYQKLEQGFFKDAKTIIALQAVRERLPGAKAGKAV